MERITKNIKIEGATLIRKNFRGKESDYNDAGNRNFGVLIDDEMADALIEDGWNVKRLRPLADDPEDAGRAWLPVKVKFGNIPPDVVLITSRGKIKMDEETVGQLDWTRFSNVDLIIRPYNYPARPGRPGGVSAYLKALYATVDETDDLAYKYSSVPDFK